MTHLLQTLNWDVTWWLILTWAAELLAIATMPSVLIQRRGQPLAALAWLFGLLALPFFGVILWWGIGRTHLKRKRRRRVSAHWRISKGFASLRPSREALPPEIMEKLHPIKRLPMEESAGVFPPVPHNRVKLLVDGDMTYETLEKMIRESRSHVHCLFYIWQPDAVGRRFRDLLAEKASEGVEVRLLCDAMGSSKVTGRFMAPLEEAGGKVAFFMPNRLFRRALTINFRNHRKIVVSDGRAGFTGGLNIGEEYCRNWRDMGLLLHGPVVAQLQEVFAEDWYFTTGENLAEPGYFQWAGKEMKPASGEHNAVCSIIAGGPDSRYNATHDAFFIAITNARERIFITTPYLTPNQAMQAALRTAVFRGVDVRLLVPKKADLPFLTWAGRSYYPALLSSGIRIFEYEAGTLHEKMWIFDRDLSVVGTANLDTRSFKLNFETSCFIHSPEVNGALYKLYKKDLSESREVTMESLRLKGGTERLGEAVANLLSPLF
ncbi:MAG: cardiolipin synthase [Acidobacteriota bacterium]